VIRDYEIYDNFFEFPDKVLDLMYQQKYYPSPRNKKNKKFKLKKNNIPKSTQQRVLNIDVPNDESTDATNPLYWYGYRTDNLHYIDEFFNSYFYYNLYKKLFNKYLISEISHVSEAYFHMTTADIASDDAWYHEDTPCLYAGVVYLSKNPPKDSGTILKVDGKEVALENVFNRLVIYNANLTHRPGNSFGDSFKSARATLVFFIKKLSISAHPYPEKGAFEIRPRDFSSFIF
jgi:hypothetical protein